MRRFNLGDISLYLAPPRMSLKRVPSHYVGNFSILVEQHVNYKVEVSHLCLFHQILMHYIPLDNPRYGAGMV